MHQQLKFGIDAILAPSFGIVPSFSGSGSTAGYASCANGASPEASSSSSHSPSGSMTTSPLSGTCVPSERSVFPAWVFCTRYSDRPSSGSRTRKPRKRESVSSEDEKRPRTAFTAEQLDRLKKQFVDNRYLTEKRRQELAHELGLNESQIKIWFQNKRAKLKKATGERPSYGLQLLAQGLYNRGISH